jgi:hypothetical protein
MTITKALPGDTPDYQKKRDYRKKTQYNNNNNEKTFLAIKVRTCFQVSMHLRVFFVANPFRLRTRRTGDIRCLKPWGLHQLHTLMIFGNGTHSKGDPNPAHLTFTQSQSVWKDCENPKFHTHQRPSC